MMAEFVRDNVAPAGWPLCLCMAVAVLALLAACAPVNAPDPVTVKQKFRADLAGFCLRDPAAPGCETFSKRVSR